MADARHDGPFRAPDQVRRRRSLGQAPHPLANLQHVGEAVSGQEVDAHHRGEGKIRERISDAERLAGEALVAAPFARQQPGGLLIGDRALAGLSQADINSLDGLVRNIFGTKGGERHLLKLGKRMDSKADDPIDVFLRKGQGFKSEKRIFDLEARYLSDVIAEKSDLLGRFARWVAGAGKQAQFDFG